MTQLVKYRGVARRMLATVACEVMVFVVAVFAVAALTAADASAQKYPERRVARQGTKLYNSGDFEGAEVRYRHALEVDPEFREAQLNLGDALLRQEKAEEAARAYADVAADSLAAVSSQAGAELVSAANYNIGNVMLAGQKIDEAIESYKQSLRLNPGDMEAKFNLAYAQKLKQEQEDQGGGGQDDQDQDQNQNDEGDQDEQESGGDNSEGDGDQDQQDGDGDEQEGDGKQNEDGQQPPQQGDGQDEQEGGGEQEREATISHEDAAHMLEAMQGEEDKTREKMNAREVPAVGRSGKNW